MSALSVPPRAHQYHAAKVTVRAVACKSDYAGQLLDDRRWAQSKCLAIRSRDLLVDLVGANDSVMIETGFATPIA